MLKQCGDVCGFHTVFLMFFFRKNMFLIGFSSWGCYCIISNVGPDVIAGCGLFIYFKEIGNEA